MFVLGEGKSAKISQRQDGGTRPFGCCFCLCPAVFVTLATAFFVIPPPLTLFWATLDKFQPIFGTTFGCLHNLAPCPPLKSWGVKFSHFGYLWLRHSCPCFVTMYSLKIKFEKRKPIQACRPTSCPKKIAGASTP